jgi:predicted extracellular nuclease
MSGEGGAGGAGESAPNLFFSEYLEAATTDPDAVEIINKSGADMNLAGCTVLVHENGSVAATATIALSGTVDDGDVFVLCTAAIGARCDQTSAALDLDGNDAVVLRCGTTVLDVIGRTIGASPGSQWGNTTVGTLNQTLRRHCEVTIGDRNGENPFAPSAEWSSFAVGTVTGLGSATCS